MYLEYLGGERLNSWVTMPSGRHQATDEIIVRFQGDDGYRYTFTFLPGFSCDGGSVPWCFRWFVPSWDEDNPELNIAYALHDGLYGSELLSRRAADDVLETMLYVAGLSTLRATTVKYAVANGGRKHYGKAADKYDDRLFFKMVRYKL